MVAVKYFQHFLNVIDKTHAHCKFLSFYFSWNLVWKQEDVFLYKVKCWITTNLWKSDKHHSLISAWKKAKRKLQKFLEYHPELTNPTEVRRDFNRNDIVKLPKIILKTFIGKGNRLRRRSTQVCLITKVSLTLKTFIWKHILTNPLCKQ